LTLKYWMRLYALRKNRSFTPNLSGEEVIRETTKAVSEGPSGT
jgi:hypothetical protein